ncbi:hypothetical protein [Vibrio harveyi]
MKRKVAGLLFGVGLGLGFVPIGIASLLVGKNLFTEAVERMDSFWKELDSQS